MREPRRVLVIGGSDSSGGAGVTRDERVLAGCGVACVCAVTAVTAQTDARVISVHGVPADVVRDQIRAALETRPVRAVKIGMLGTLAVLEAVARELPPRDAVPIVLDPVLAASSGGELLDAAGCAALRTELLPRVTLVTPNLQEAAVLLGEAAAEDEAAMAAQARRLQRLGPEAVLIKGGHADGAESVDVLVAADGESERFSSARLPVRMRGTGCMLSSAVAAALARGVPLAAACRYGKRYVSSQLARCSLAVSS